MRWFVRTVCSSRLALVVGMAASAKAQEADGQDIGQAANDPTAPLTALQFSDWFTADFHQLDDESEGADPPSASPQGAAMSCGARSIRTYLHGRGR